MTNCKEVVHLFYSIHNYKVVCNMLIVVFSFLVAREKGTSRPVAYVSYRYDIDEGDEVVYW